MQKGQTGILILVGILVLVGIAGGAYFLGKSGKPQPVISQPQSTPLPTSLPKTASVPVASPSGTAETANWKTYTSSKYSIKYPDNWSVFKLKYPGYPALNPPSLSPDGSLEVIVTEKDHYPIYNETDTVGRVLINFRIDINAEELSNSKKLAVEGPSKCQVSKTFVGGITAFKASCPQETSWYFEAKDKTGTFQIESSWPESANSTASLLFNQILSTFRFIQ